MEHERKNIYREEQQDSGQAFASKYHTSSVPNRHHLSSVLIEKTSFQVSRSIRQKKCFHFWGYATV